MHSTMVFAVFILTSIASYLPRNSEALPTRVPEAERNDMDMRDQNKRSDLKELQGLFGKVQANLLKSCQPGQPANPWCEYMQSLKRNAGSEPAEKVNKKSNGLQCWPGIPFCKKSPATRPLEDQPQKTIRRSVTRCRPGVSTCPNGKRTLGTVNNVRPLANKLVELQGWLGKVQFSLLKSCQPGQPTSPWCDYLQSLERNAGSEPAENLSEKSERPQCWPFCKRSSATKSLEVQPQKIIRRSVTRCRPGVSVCPNGKRTLTTVSIRNEDCPFGWPWCI